MKLFPLKLHEYLFLFAGVGMLIALPWFEQFGVTVWYITKSAYLAGVLLFILNTIKDVRN